MKRQVPFQGFELPAVNEADKVIGRNRLPNLGGRLSIFGRDLFFDRRIAKGSQCLMDSADDTSDVVDLDRIIVEVRRRYFCGQRH